MDSETIKSVLSILGYGALFLLMMRFGCGRHVMGGHGHHDSRGGEKDAGAGGSSTDPVCGMEVDHSKAAAASVYSRRTYYFCSASCRDKFEKSPEQYATASAEVRVPQGGLHHG